MYMAHSNRLVWPQQWHTQTRCADGLLLLHIYSVDYLYAPAVVNCEVGSTVESRKIATKDWSSETGEECYVLIVVDRVSSISAQPTILVLVQVSSTICAQRTPPCAKKSQIIISFFKKVCQCLTSSSTTKDVRQPKAQVPEPFSDHHRRKRIAKANCMPRRVGRKVHKSCNAAWVLHAVQTLGG